MLNKIRLCILLKNKKKILRENNDVLSIVHHQTKIKEEPASSPNNHLHHLTQIINIGGELERLNVDV